MTRAFVLAAALILPVAAAGQAVTPSPIITAAPPAVPPATPPALHRLTPDEIAAAQADGAERNRAAELLAMSHGDADLLLPAEKKKPQVHGEAGVAFASHGYREAFGSETTTLGDGTTVSVAGDYQTFGRTRHP